MAGLKIEPGDLVVLKSGGPEMTVSHVIDPTSENGNVAVCKWFAGKTVQEGSFPAVSLRFSSGDPKAQAAKRVQSPELRGLIEEISAYLFANGATSTAVYSRVQEWLAKTDA